MSQALLKAGRSWAGWALNVLVVKTPQFCQHVVYAAHVGLASAMLEADSTWGESTVPNVLLSASSLSVLQAATARHNDSFHEMLWPKNDACQWSGGKQERCLAWEGLLPWSWAARYGPEGVIDRLSFGILRGTGRQRYWLHMPCWLRASSVRILCTMQTAG